ncbi:MAG TPA: hypothetical protein VMV82_03445 [Candidatus Dormibacteraeota bacterium]|nr:hypothetical protein [Candidatus Dormibacteraeota bacterium]
MLTRIIGATLAFSITAAAALAAPTPKPATLSPKPQASEVAFVTHITQTLTATYPTVADAERAGYFRYTNEDNTGAISYANLHWTSNDWNHPSQLWYDVHGNLLGADFSEPYVAGKPPSLWGVLPGRWIHIPEHVHYVLVGAHGPQGFEHGVEASAFTAAGGSLADPQVATLVKMHKVKSASQVARIFTFANIWDLIVWVKRNPNGAFAEKNPLVHPSSTPAHDSM